MYIVDNDEKKKVRVFTHVDHGKDKDKTETVMPDMYHARVNRHMFGISFALHKIFDNSEELIDIKSGIFRETIDFISNHFQDRVKEIYQSLKISHKAGILLYGPQGTGKTTIMYQIARKFVKDNNAIVLCFSPCDSSEIKYALDKVRESNPHNTIICIFDEFEIFVHQDEEGLLPLLDGISSPENVIFLASTNYIENIPDRVCKRPSRFNFVREVVSLPIEAYQQFVDEKLNGLRLSISNEEIAFKSEQERLKIDELKHVIINMAISNLNFEDALQTINR